MTTPKLPEGVADPGTSNPPPAAAAAATSSADEAAATAAPKEEGKEDEKGGGVPSWLATALFIVFLAGLLGGVAWKLWEGRSAPAIAPAIAPAPTVTIPSATEWHKGGSEVSEYR